MSLQLSKKEDQNKPEEDQNTLRGQIETQRENDIFSERDRKKIAILMLLGMLPH